MEINEGNIRITTQPFITIGDQPLSKCEFPVVAKELQSLCVKIEEQRRTIRLLNQRLQEGILNASD